MSEYFPKPNSLGENVKVELDLANLATEADLKNETGVDTSRLAKNVNLASLKSNVDTSKFAKNVDLASLKSNVDKLDTDKLKNVPTD